MFLPFSLIVFIKSIQRLCRLFMVVSALSEICPLISFAWLWLEVLLQLLLDWAIFLKLIRLLNNLKLIIIFKCSITYFFLKNMEIKKTFDQFYKIYLSLLLQKVLLKFVCSFSPRLLTKYLAWIFFRSLRQLLQLTSHF